MKVVAALLASMAFVLAEPPVPSSQYLPSNQYGPPSAPSNQYGAPSAPSNQYGAPRGISAPSSQYGAPSHTTATFRGNGGNGGSNQYVPPAPSSQYGAPNGGGANGYGRGGSDDQSEPANYNFEYHVEDAASGNSFGHQESRQGDVANGKYYVLLPDGRRQTVEYTADNDGYHPRISYEQVNNGYNGGGGNGGYAGNGGYSGGQGGGNGNGGYQY